MTSSSCENAIVAVLNLAGFDQQRYSRDFREGECISVGSDASADVRLVDDRVSSTHCMIFARGGAITVRDCFSEFGTFVDEVRIRELQLTENAEIRVGTTTMAVTLSARGAASRAPQPLCTSNTNGDARTGKATPVKENLDSPFLTIDKLQLQLEQAHGEIDALQTRLAGGTAHLVENSDPYQDEMIELLRAEVVDLQAALADRDQSRADMLSGSCGPSEDDNVLSGDQAEHLVERLEQLLEELQQRDEQIATLTDLLQVEEEANRAEQEERRHIDAWLSDIERRFGDREKDWSSRESRLQAELAKMADERNRAESALNAETSGARMEAAQKAIMGLREAADSHQRLLLTSEQTVTELRNELELSRRPIAREEMVRLAEERAEVARLRQELEAARQKQQPVDVSDETLKFKALRQHLNDIHEQERKARDDRKFSSRIARLWGRLEGR